MYAVYAALSGVPVVALGVVLSATHHAAAQDQGLAQGRAQAVVIVEMAVSPVLYGDDLTEGLSTRERARLARATDLAVFTGSVLRLRPRGFGGRVVFSDDGREDQVVDPSSAAFRAPAVGETTATVVRTPGGPVVRVLSPSSRSRGAIGTVTADGGAPVRQTGS